MSTSTIEFGSGLPSSSSTQRETFTNSKKIDYVYNEQKQYEIQVKPGRYEIEVHVESHKNATMNIYVPPQENNLSIVKDQFKELPNNVEAELAVIGSILVSNDIFDEINNIKFFRKYN